MRINKIELKKQFPYDDYVEIEDEFGNSYKIYAQQILDILMGDGQICELCEGSGEISVHEEVSNEPGAPKAMVGTAPCDCKGG